MRDDFSPKTIETLAKRVGCRCSNPGCRKLTSGPHEEAHRSVNIGVAAHITAAASGGKRYDASLSSEQRKSIENGMWLCQNCGKLIDSDEQKYSVDLIMSWKHEAERQASSEIESLMSPVSKDISSGFEQYLQNLIDRPQSWWLDEIKDSTWYEFELFTKVQEKPEQTGARKPQESSKPLLSAIHDGDNRSILITGAPGAGKSTFLEKLVLEAARKSQKESNAPIPVLVRLKDYESSGEQPGIRGLIQSALESYDPSLDSEATQQLLQGKGRTLLLLIDGWNELSDEKAKSKIKTFCQPHSVIVTSRNAGDYSEIQQKFEIQPLSRSDVEGFFEKRFEKRLPNIERKRLQELVDRVQDFGQTPLMVWMLFSIFRNDDLIPKTRGEAYRAFTAIYAKRAKAGVDLSEARKLLGKLAFEMMKSPNPKDPTEFRSKVPEVEAGEILGSEAELDRMLNHLLNHQGREGIREISFCHQSLQEYYAAEHLRLELGQHPEWREKQANEEYSWLQHHYLNYTKWTEPIALMLGLPEVTQTLAEQVVEKALGVDLMLGARLAGEVRSDLHKITLEILHHTIIGNQAAIWLRIRLFGETKSHDAVHYLSNFIQNSEDAMDRRQATWALRGLPLKFTIPVFQAVLKDSDESVREQAVWGLGESKSDESIPVIMSALQDPSPKVRERMVYTLAEISCSDSVFGILKVLADALSRYGASRPSKIEDTWKAPSEGECTIITMAEYILREEMDYAVVSSALIQVLAQTDQDSCERKYAAKILGSIAQVSDDAVAQALTHAEKDSDRAVADSAWAALHQLEAKSHQENPAYQTQNYRQEPIQIWVDRLESSNPTVRGNAVFELAYLLERNAAIEIVRSALNDTSPYVKSHAVRLFTEFVGRESLDVVTQVLYDDNLEVQRAAVQALIKVQGMSPDKIKIELREEFVQDLIKKVQENSQSYDGVQATEILTNLFAFQDNLASRPDVKTALLKAIETPNYLLRSYALTGLQKIPDKDVVNCLEVLLSDPNELTSANCAEALGKMPPSFTAEILPRLKCLMLAPARSSVIEAITTIQENCKFYNYEIFHSPPAKPQPAQQSPPGTTNNYYGDYIEGDKIERDKILGNKTEAPNATEVKIIEHIDNYHASPPRDPPP